MILCIQGMEPGCIVSMLVGLGVLEDVAANGDQIAPATFGEVRMISDHLQPQNCNTQPLP